MARRWIFFAAEQRDPIGSGPVANARETFLERPRSRQPVVKDVAIAVVHFWVRRTAAKLSSKK